MEKPRQQRLFGGRNGYERIDGLHTSRKLTGHPELRLHQLLPCPPCLQQVWRAGATSAWGGQRHSGGSQAQQAALACIGLRQGGMDNPGTSAVPDSPSTDWAACSITQHPARQHLGGGGIMADQRVNHRRNALHVACR